jgi:hypothetical protein
MNQNQPLRYAIHQLARKTGIVAINDHMNEGRISSVRSPRIVKLAQKIFFCMQ